MRTLISLFVHSPPPTRYAQLARGESDDLNAVEALGDFQRFPTWSVHLSPLVEPISTHTAIFFPPCSLGMLGIDKDVEVACAGDLN